MQRQLRQSLVGVYLAGSLALDAYAPGRSDVDIAVVCSQALSRGQKERLLSAVAHRALPCPARGLELVVYSRAAAASGTPLPGFECELNDGPRMPYRVTYDPAERPPEDGRFWYGLDRSILHQHGRALCGPAAAEVFGDLADDDLRRLLLDALRWWIALPAPPGDAPAPGADDAVLGACRSLVRHQEGRWLSKTRSGRRLIELGWSSPIIQQSIACRQGGRSPTGAAARAFQQQVLEVIMTAVVDHSPTGSPLPTRVTGHRGARGLWPENSLEGFAGVSSLHVDAIEFDVHRTDAGELLVLHDPWLERTTDGSGPVRQLSPEARRQLRLRGSSESLPTLSEVLDVLAPATTAELHVELKNDEAGHPYPWLIEETLSEIDRRSLRGRCHLASFDVGVLAACRRTAPDLRRLVSVDADWAARQGGLEHFLRQVDGLVDLVAVHHGLLTEHWDLACALLPPDRLCVWTVNDPAQIAAWFRRGVGHLTTDRPDLALDVRLSGLP